MSRQRPAVLALILSLTLHLDCSPPIGTTDGDADGDGDTDGDAWVPPDSDYDLPTCETSTHFAEPLPATLMLQLDTSGSMNCRADARSCADGEPTADPDDSRWDVLRARLDETLAILPDSTSVGLMRYPQEGSSCASATPLVPISELGSSREALAAALGAVVPDGITPTHDAVLHALAQLGSSSSEEGKFLVLATDGAATVCAGCDPGCSWDALDGDHEQMVRDLADAAADGRRTFVIGVPGSGGFREILSRMASAGDTARSSTCAATGAEPCHFDLTDPDLDFASALAETLAVIGDAVISCEYDIPPNPEGHFDPGQVNVRFTDESGDEVVIPRDPSRHDGWDYSDDETRIVLHGSECDRVRAATGGRIDIAFGCPTILI